MANFGANWVDGLKTSNQKRKEAMNYLRRNKFIALDKPDHYELPSVVLAMAPQTRDVYLKPTKATFPKQNSFHRLIMRSSHVSDSVTARHLEQFGGGGETVAILRKNLDGVLNEFEQQLYPGVYELFDLEDLGDEEFLVCKNRCPIDEQTIKDKKLTIMIVVLSIGASDDLIPHRKWLQGTLALGTVSYGSAQMFIFGYKLLKEDNHRMKIIDSSTLAITLLLSSTIASYL